MTIRLAIALVAATIAFGKNVEAATIASAPNYGGVTVRNGGFVDCRLFNAGTGTAQLSSLQIFDASNNAVQLSVNTCGASLGPNGVCEFDADIPGNLAFSCRAAYSGTGVLLRGVTEVLDTGHNFLNDLPMQ